LEIERRFKEELDIPCNAMHDHVTYYSGSIVSQLGEIAKKKIGKG
jgi:hypothetical protein